MNLSVRMVKALPSGSAMPTPNKFIQASFMPMRPMVEK
jgi:hypothetical protein